MKRLRKLCEAVRTIHSSAELRFFGVPDRDDIWIVRVAVKDIVLVETAAGPLEHVMDEAAKKLRAMSQRMLEAISQQEAEARIGESTIPPPPVTPRVPVTTSGMIKKPTAEDGVPSSDVEHLGVKTRGSAF